MTELCASARQGVMAQKRVLTGIRPTGPLHLGHYAGALENWVKLQHEYNCSFLIADYQVADYADNLPRVRSAVWEVALDWLAVGLDPESSRFVIESAVPEHELGRETARRFNREVRSIFAEPEALLGRVPRLVGTDGNAKMSKSRGNTIDLKDSAETVAKKVRRMYGGPPRSAKEAGKVQENPVFLYLDAFDHDTAQVQNLKERYERTGVSNQELKDR